MSDKYIPEICECCKQSKTYLLPIDRGTVDIVKAVARAIREKGINCVHPRKEIEGKFLTSNQVGNLSRPRFHGLIAKVKSNKGNYCLTKKGSDFLKGMPIPKYAIISKAEGHQIGYWKPEEETCTVYKMTGQDYWEGTGFEIIEGQVVKNVQELKQSQLL